MKKDKPNSLLKEEIAQQIQKQFSLQSTQIAKEIVDSVESVIQTALANGREVKLGRLGSLKPRLSKQRFGRNPHSGERIIIPQKTTVTFKPYSPLLDELNPVK